MSRHVFLHIGDAHFGPGERNADRYAALDQIIRHGYELALKGELAGWLWPGDLGHARLTIADLNALDQQLLRMAHRAPVVICYGNHEQPGDLDGFARLNSIFPIHVISRPQVLTLDTATNAKAAIFVLPYPHRAGLVSTGADHASLGDVARSALEPIFMNAAAELVDAARAGAMTLAIGHVNVGGSIASTGQPQIGREIELDPALLARLEAAEYIGLNHIHKHQVVHGAVYAGSICRLDFGEREEKGFVEVVLESRLDRAARAPWRFVPLDVPQQFDITGELTRDRFVPDDPFCDVCSDGDDASDTCDDCDQRHCQICEPCDADCEPFYRWRGADVRVRYRFLKADAGVINTDLLKELFKEARSLKLEGQPQLTHEMRAPEIAAAATLDAKVAKYCELQKIVAGAGFRAKLTALQSTDPDAILTSLSISLATVGATPAETTAA